ncbi:MAG: PTS system glucose-specific IIC component [Flavobacteriales bacterium]|jgi:PTS system glucose-specific IIC component
MKFIHSSFGVLQQIGKSLMLPVAVLPAAGILLAVGAAEFDVVPLVISQMMKSAGDAVFGNLPIIFAIGVSLGLTKNDGVASLAAVVFYGVLLASMGVSANYLGYETKEIIGIPSIDTGVFGGILSGLAAAKLFNRYYRIQLPDYLGFFGGKRFVPIAAAVTGIFAGIIMSFVWPPIGEGIDTFSDWAANGNPILAFSIYGFVERLLIPFGLHHIWNAPFFFEVGSFVDPDTGEIIRGEIQRFAAGDKTAGALAGGYLFKMWGLPAAALAIWHTAKPGSRAKVGGIMISGALTSFLTGITEPIEFAFMFVAPLLYLVHAVMVSAAFALCIELGIKHGTTFSHGLIDFLTLSPQSTNAGWLVVLGPIWALGYYTVFRFAIQKFNLLTPGREEATSGVEANQVEGLMAHQLVLAFGGRSNILDLDACITRIRVTAKDIDKANVEKLKSLGASGVLVIGDNLQAIFGTSSENLKTDMEIYLESAGSEAELGADKVSVTDGPEVVCAIVPEAKPLNGHEYAKLLAMISALGGLDNISRVNDFAETRVRLELANDEKVNGSALLDAGATGLSRLNNGVVHVIIGFDATRYANAMLEAVERQHDNGTDNLTPALS